MEKILKNLTPIHVPQPKDNRISELEKDLIKVKHVSNLTIALCVDIYSRYLLSFALVTCLFAQDYIMSLAKGSEIPKSNSSHTNISKLLFDQKNKQRQLREEIKVNTRDVCSSIFVFVKILCEIAFAGTCRTPHVRSCAGIFTAKAPSSYQRRFSSVVSNKWTNACT